MKAVIFDLDDTLILERDFVFSGYRAVARYLSVKAGTDEDRIYGLLREEFERSAKNVFNRMYDRLGIAYTEEDIKDLVRVYREHEPDIGFCEDVLPALKDLKEAGCRLGVLTDGYLVTQKNKAKAVELDRHFEAIVYTDELGREYWKPSIKGFEILSEKLGAPLDSMVFAWLSFLAGSVLFGQYEFCGICLAWCMTAASLFLVQKRFRSLADDKTARDMAFLLLCLPGGVFLMLPGWAPVLLLLCAVGFDVLGKRLHSWKARFSPVAYGWMITVCAVLSAAVTIAAAEGRIG